jgi:hypothetical protein
MLKIVIWAVVAILLLFLNPNGAKADSISQELKFSNSKSEIFRFDGFNPAAGTLTSVHLNWSVDLRLSGTCRPGGLNFCAINSYITFDGDPFIKGNYTNDYWVSSHRDATGPPV